MEKKKFKLGLLPRLIIAIIIGILFGQFLPEWFCRIVVTASAIFSTFLSFVIPLMILAYVTMGIANLKNGAGKLLLITVVIAYVSTLIAGSSSYLVSRQPVHQLYERRRSGADSGYCGQFPGDLFQPGHPCPAGYPFCGGDGLYAWSVPVIPAGKDYRRYPL